MTTKIYAIHGAFSTPRMFSFLKTNLSEYSWDFLKYRTTEPNIDSLVDKAIDENKNSDMCHVVGHSMGGLIALSLAGQSWVKSITTIATPLGGIDMNILQSYLTRSNILSEISSSSKFIRQLHEMSNSKPTLRIITTAGFNPFMWEPNDGVVTVRSQRYQSHGIYKDIESNHQEVMLDMQTVDILRDWWNISCNVA